MEKHGSFKTEIHEKKGGRKQSVKDNRRRINSHFSSLQQWFVNSIYSVPEKNVMPVRKPNDYSIFKKAYDILRFLKYLCRDVKKDTFAKGSILIPIYIFVTYLVC